jgi:16S rRNA (cytosine967-C5)-methyltransferase
VLIALRLGIYQLRFLDRIPPSAAVNESVKLMRIARLRSAEGLVNAVLRRATREPDYDPLREIDNEIERLAVETSHPAWLLEKWITDFGSEFTREFAQANNVTPRISFRVVRHGGAETKLIEELQSEGARLVKSEIAQGAWLFEGPASQLLRLASEGRVYLQDEVSQRVAEIVANCPGALVLDLCAAPGSKSTLIADLKANSGNVIACDVSEPRLKTVAQTVQLHGLNNVQCVLLDGLKPLPFRKSSFDTVLVDAPCSGTGTLRRNPEIRWRITAADIRELSARQTQLLEFATTVLKESGTIVYSTCSVEPEENEHVVNSFLSRHPEFEEVAFPNGGSLKTDANALRSWPHIHGCDGFYVTLLRCKDLEN